MSAAGWLTCTRDGKAQHTARIFFFATQSQSYVVTPIGRFLEALGGPAYSEARSNPYSYAVDASVLPPDAKQGA